MNAPVATALLAQAETVDLPLEAFRPSGTHVQELRRKRFSKETLAELARNIADVGGVLQPILARPLDKPEPGLRYEIVAGERRWLAAKAAGLQTIPAIVRPLTHVQVLKMQLSENLEREDLHPLEEALGFQELLLAEGTKAGELGDTLGKSRAWIYNRLKLLDLCPEGRQAFYEGKLNASTAMLIARIASFDHQRRAMKEITDDHYDDGPMSYREAREHIAEEYMLELKGAPFKLDDAELVKAAGPCTTCPKRTGNQKDLFTDVKNPNVCTDPKCFDTKRQAVHVVARKALEAKGEEIVHGDAAKKIFPQWEDGSSSIGGGYEKLDDTSWASGRGVKIRTLFEKGAKAIKKVQHPLTGEIIEVAHQSAIASAAKGDKNPEVRERKKKASAAKAKLPKLPEIDDMLVERLAGLIYDKTPAKFTKALLLQVLQLVVPAMSLRSEGLDQVIKLHGWPKSAFRSHNYGSPHLPAEASKLDERGLMRLMFLVAYSDRAYWYRREDLLKLFGINEQKVRDGIKAERVATMAEARMKAKVQQSSPTAPAKKPATKAKAKKK